jgi:integrase/recombinase XerD
METKRSYLFEITSFRRFVDKPLWGVSREDAQRFAQHLDTLKLAPASRRKALSTLKSLFAFCVREEYLNRDVMRSLPLPKAEDGLARRIMEEGDAWRLVDASPLSPRDHTILLALYQFGLRVSELTGLTWADVRRRESGCQLSVLGKGSKRRTVFDKTSEVATKILCLRLPGDTDADPVFRSRKKGSFGGHISRQQVHHIVKIAALLAGVDPKCSPHWLRHCHASHALRNQIDITTVRDTLGHTNIATTSRYLHACPLKSSSDGIRRPDARDQRFVRDRRAKPRAKPRRATIRPPADPRAVGARRAAAATAGGPNRKSLR